MVFDAPEPNDGMPVVWPRVWLDTTNATYGTTDTQNSAVVILRHGAIGYALQDAAWAKYQLGEAFKINDGSAPAVRNLWIKPLPLPLPGTGIERQATRDAEQTAGTGRFEFRAPAVLFSPALRR